MQPEDLQQIRTAIKEEVRTAVKEEVKTTFREEVRAIVKEETRAIVKEETRAIVRDETRAIVRDELKTYHEETLLPTFGKYTEEIVLPAIQASEIRIKQEFKLEIGKLRSDLVDFVSRQISDARAEIIKEIRAERERNRVFQTTVMEILERHKLARPDEIQLLRGLLGQAT